MTEYSNEQVVDSFLDHVRYLNIAHHVHGRVRIKASLNGARKLASMEEGEIENVIVRIPGIEEFRINRKALSVVITYDSEVLSFSLWEKVGRLGEYPTNREGVRVQLLDILNRQ